MKAQSIVTKIINLKFFLILMSVFLIHIVPTVIPETLAKTIDEIEVAELRDWTSTSNYMLLELEGETEEIEEIAEDEPDEEASVLLDENANPEDDVESDVLSEDDFVSESEYEEDADHEDELPIQDFSSPDDIGLLSITRSEFEEMSREELENHGAVFLTRPNARMINACPIIDGSDFVANIIVDGVICVTDAVTFREAWANNMDVIRIVLMQNITINGTGTTPAALAAGSLPETTVRTAPIEIDGNRNTLTLTGAAAAATNPVLRLGAPTVAGTELQLNLNNINFRRTNTGSAANQDAASPFNIFSSTGETHVEAANTMPVCRPGTGSSSSNASGACTGALSGTSHNWHITIRDNVTTGTEGTTEEAINNISGLIQAPYARMTVTGSGNQLNMFGRGAAGATTGTYQIHIRNFEMLANAQLIIRSHGSAATSVYINNVHSRIGTGTSQTVNVAQPGSVILRSNAELTIYNRSIRTGHDTPQPSATSLSGTNGAANPGGNTRRGHGLYGFMTTFTMEGGSRMDIDSTGVGFRSRASTTYTMTGGAQKSVYSRQLSTTYRRPAWVLANNYVSGSSSGGAAGNSIPNRYAFGRHVVTISGEGTLLDIEGYPTSSTIGSSMRGNLIMMGNNSTFNVTDGAILNNVSHNSTAMLFFGQGTNFNVNNYGQMNITVHGSANSDSGAFRFLQTGAQTFTLDSYGEVNVLATAGNAGLLRAYGGNNAFIVDGGALMILHHSGPNNIVTSGIDFAGSTSWDSRNPDRFILNGYRSEVSIIVNRGPAVDHSRSGSITQIEANEGTVFTIEANSHGDSGIFNVAELRMHLDRPLYFDFTNTSSLHQAAPTAAMNEGLIFNTSSGSRMVGTSTDLSVWRNTRGGAATSSDPIIGNPGGFWSNMTFDLRPATANFANASLLANSPGPNINTEVFATWFNGPALTRFGSGGTGGNNGWRQIRRISANNAHPIVDILRTPTDADQHIFGHVTIPEGNRSARSAFDNEVFVDLVINDGEGNFVQRINNVPTGSHSIWGAPEHMGVFKAEIDFNVGFAEGTTFLPVDYTVEVARARRAAVVNPTPPSTTDVDAPTTGNIVHYRPTRLGAPPRLPDIRTGVETVVDITPPTQVDEVTGLIAGNLRFGGAITPATTSITGTGEPGAIIRVGRVTPATENAAVTAVSWLDASVMVDGDGNWEFDIPASTNLTVGERLSIYISDNKGLSDLENLGNITLPEVIHRRAENDETLNSRINIVQFTLPRTAITQPWAGATLGNINYHWNERTEFHDAIGVNAFDYAYLLTVVEAGIEVDFRWNFDDAPDEGRFLLDHISHGEQVSRPSPNPERTNYSFIHWTTDPAGNNEFDFNTQLFYETRLYAQWLPDPVFEFTKTDGTTPLAGAVFNLYQRNEDGTDWEMTPFATVTSGEDGLVEFGALIREEQYRLVETQAPTGFDAPTGYWIITTDKENLTIEIPTTQGNAPNFTDHDGNFYLANVRTFIPPTGVDVNIEFYLSLSLVGITTFLFIRRYNSWRKRKEQLEG